MIKFWSYNREYKKYGNIFLKKIKKTLDKGTIFFGDQLNLFERNFVIKYKGKYGIAVRSGTDALLISLKALNLKPRDEVITAANTAIPTISAIINSGAKPKLVDIGEDYLIDAKKIEKQINSRTKAIIPVHLYGQACDMKKILKISKKYKIPIIEDCAQSQGAKFKNKFVGTFGTFGCFSFYPTKILGSYGDGGFILTDNFQLYKKIKRLRFYGIETEDRRNKYHGKYYANENGYNSRLDEIQASILNLKFKKIDYLVKRRRQLVKIYTKNLRDTNLILPYENPNCRHVYHLFTICHSKASKLIAKLKKLKIETRKIYPYPIHRMKAYSHLFLNKKDLRNSEKKAKGILCLPLYPDLKDEEVKKVCRSLRKILVNI